MTDIQRRAAIRAALLDLTMTERLDLMNAVENDDLDAAERAKLHPLRADKFTAEELASLKANLLDGGGVVDDAQLMRTVLQAVLDDDWPTVFKQIPHVLKSWFKQRGAVTIQRGAVVLQGFGPTPKPLGKGA